MLHTNTVARAIELARSGECQTIEQIENALAHEGFSQIHQHLAGPAIRRQLRQMMETAGNGQCGKLATGEIDDEAGTMTDSSNWLTELRALIDRHAGEADAAEHLSLSAQDLFDTVPDAEICEAFLNIGDWADDPVATVLAAECERRNLDF